MTKDRSECGTGIDGCYQLRCAIKGVWTKIRGVLYGIALAFGLGTYLFGIDVVSMSKEYPKTKDIVQTNVTEIAVIKKGQENILSAQNETNRLLRKLLKEEKEETPKKPDSDKK